MRFSFKQELWIGTITLVVIALLLSAFIWKYRSITALGLQRNPKVTTPSATPQPNATPTLPGAESEIMYSLPTVQTHNQPTDCWLIIDHQVYDVTNYLDQHPGGARRIVPYCGQEATQAFATQGGEGQHSAFAQQVLQQFKIGQLTTQGEG